MSTPSLSAKVLLTAIFLFSFHLALSAASLLPWKSDKGNVITTSLIKVRAGERLFHQADEVNFKLSGEAYTTPQSCAALLFHTNGKSGYEVLFRGGPIDGTLKTGSLTGIRNLYRSLTPDNSWFPFEITVRGRNILITLNGVNVVCYTQPEHPYRTAAFASRLLGHGGFALRGKKGRVAFRHLTISSLPATSVNPNDTLPTIDEQQDSIIRLQQRFFPVIDYHVHLKGGLTKEQAHAMSMNYGINYGVAPNAGEGGVGRMLSNDAETYSYFREVAPLPFLRGVQGEGRRWSTQFSPQALSVFDYLFTDAMTIVDNGKICRLYHPDEVVLNGRSKEQYMDLIVDQIVKILTNEPADIYANATYLPDIMQNDYDALWTDARINRVLDVLQKYHIAMEISPRYQIPSIKIIRMAKKRGLKFTFGTNNVDAHFGKLEYAIRAIHECGITSSDIWFPSMSIRKTRSVVDYNHFGKH